MCGIFGYIGKDEHSVLKVIHGLQGLEYRGYDSWGVAVKTPRGIFSKKAVGKVSTISVDDFKNIFGTTAIGHTRWATHGGVREKNAHPHWNKDKTIAVVHNGIIENHEDLKKTLKAKYGTLIFRSETDTEVIPLLIGLFMERGFSFEKAFVKAARKLEGRYAFAAIHKDEPFILIAKNGSPLLVGESATEHFIASDSSALLEHTRRVFFLRDNEYARITGKEAVFFSLDSALSLQKKSEEIEWGKETAGKDGYEHFMLKEISEERNLISQSVMLGASSVKKTASLFAKAKNIFFTGMGTAAHMGMAGEYIFSRIARTEARLVYAAEFDKAIPFVGEKSIVCGITQSGETADLLEAFKSAKKKNARIISIVNVRGSSAERESLVSIPVNAGPEKAVASTKAACGQLAMLFLLAYAAAGKQKQGELVLRRAGEALKKWMTGKLFKEIARISQTIAHAEDLYVIGKSMNYPVALEAALKIKEVSYIHAEGFAAGELKHGTLALIEKGVPCIILVSHDEYEGDVLSAAYELKARGACLIGIAPDKNTLFDYWIKVPALEDGTTFPLMISSQILAYYLAVSRGHDPDKPRNLAKSVTVK